MVNHRKCSNDPLDRIWAFFLHLTFLFGTFIIHGEKNWYQNDKLVSFVVKLLEIRGRGVEICIYFIAFCLNYKWFPSYQYQPADFRNFDVEVFYNKNKYYSGMLFIQMYTFHDIFKSLFIYIFSIYHLVFCCLKS